MSTPQPVSRVCGGTLATLACGATLLVWEKLACGGSLAKPRKRIPCHDPTNRSPVSPDPLSHPCHDPLSPVTDPRSTPPPPPPPSVLEHSAVALREKAAAWYWPSDDATLDQQHAGDANLANLALPGQIEIRPVKGRPSTTSTSTRRASGLGRATEDPTLQQDHEEIRTRERYGLQVHLFMVLGGQPEIRPSSSLATHPSAAS